MRRGHPVAALRLFITAYFRSIEKLILSSGPPIGFRSPRAKLQMEVPCVFDPSKQKGQKARESGETESGGIRRALNAALIGRVLNYI